MPTTKLPTFLAETDKNQISAGGSTPGWVGGTTANLAASSQVNIVFDLGQDWDQYSVIAANAFSQAPSVSGLTVLWRSSDTTSLVGVTRALRDMANTTMRPISDTFTTAQAVGSYFLKPMGRYLIAQVTNADATNAQGAGSKVTIAAFSA